MGIFPLIRISKFEVDPLFFLRQRTICGKMQMRTWRYSGKPVDKMSAVWKYFKSESSSSPAATCNICNMTVWKWGDKSAAFNTTHFTYHKVIILIALDNQLISVEEDQGFLNHLEFLNPLYALPSQHYITFIPLWSYNGTYVQKFCPEQKG